MIIDRVAFEQMIAHMEQVAPLEGVGLLAGPRDAPCPRDTDGDGDCGRKLCPHCGAERERACDRWVPMRNAAEHPRARFEIDNDELVMAWQALADAGRRPWIICHSHVTTSAAPSDNDIRYATDPTLLHAVVSLAPSVPVVALWRLDPNRPARAEQAKRIIYEVSDLGFQGNRPTDLTHGVSLD